MTDNEIIKALEDKTHKAEYSWVDSSYCDIEVSLLKNALDLIKRQQAEIELLHDDYTYKLVRRKAKAEAIKEFADELKQRVLIQPHYNDFVKEFLKIIHRNIDNLVKEMVGEE